MKTRKIIPSFLWLSLYIGFFYTASKHIFVQINAEDLTNTSFSSNLLSITSSLINIFLPIIAVSIVELYRNNLNGTINIKQLSIYKILQSEGYKYADLWYFVIGLFISEFPLIAKITSLGIVSVNSKITQLFISVFKPIIPSTTNQLSSIIIIIIAILLQDLVQYFGHRIQHSKFVWEFHELHHSATKMTIFSNYRNTPIAAIFSFLVIPFLGLSTALTSEYLSRGFMPAVYIYVVYTSIDLLAVIVGHSSLKLIFPKPFSYILLSPTLHWLHHSDNPKHYDCNFGNGISIWDRIFGTYLDESNLKDIKKFGVSGTQYNKFHPLYSMLLLPSLKLLRKFNKSFI